MDLSGSAAVGYLLMIVAVFVCLSFVNLLKNKVDLVQRWRMWKILNKKKKYDDVSYLEGFLGHAEQCNIRLRRYGGRNIEYAKAAKKIKN